MALEGTYEYECMRAELLGVEKPDYEEFMKNKAEKEAIEKDALEAEAIKEFDSQKEYFGHTSGKLDELGNILKSTQRKINILTEFDSQKEYFGHTSGKLDELGNILKSTQRKINILTAPFSVFIKSKMGRRDSAGGSKDSEADTGADASQVDHAQLKSDQDQEEYKESEEKEHNCSTENKSNKINDLATEHMPLIDGLIEKTEKNVLSMEYQIKQMKRFK